METEWAQKRKTTFKLYDALKRNKSVHAWKQVGFATRAHMSDELMNFNWFS